jgi:hypothetical protein
MKAASFACEREDREQLRHLNELVRDLRGINEAGGRLRLDGNKMR